MIAWIQTLHDFIASNPHYAYSVAFLLAMLESAPLVGAVIPGTAVILAISTLVPSGAVALLPLMGFTILGAIVGDGLSFWLGHRYHEEILRRWPFNRYPQLVERSKSFFERHGDKSVFIARFTLGVRAVVPLLAGILHMPVGRFYLANILSALVWAPSHILPAVLIGASLSHLGSATVPVIAVLVIVVVCVWLLRILLRWILRRAIPIADQIMDYGVRLSKRGDGRLSQILLVVFNSDNSQNRTLILLGCLLVVVASAFFGIVEDLVPGDPLIRADTEIYQAMQNLRTEQGDRLMIAVTELGDGFVVVAVSVAVLLWFIWKRAYRVAVQWTIAIVGASVLNTIIKSVLHRSRPGESLYTGWSAFSFPSGHSTVNLVLYGLLGIIIVKGVRSQLRAPVLLGAGTIVVLIGFSRIYLGAHYVSDVIGGMAFALAWMAVVGMVMVRYRSIPINTTGLLSLSVAVFILAGGFNIYSRHTDDVALYAVHRSTPSMSASAWRNSDWQTLPTWRIGLSGEMEEPLTIQWAEPLSTIKENLLARNWQEPPPLTLAGFKNLFGTKGSVNQLPVIPALQRGRLPSLTMIKSSNDGGQLTTKRSVLRLWPADIAITNGKQTPLWLGSIVTETGWHPVSWITLPATEDEINGPRNFLQSELQLGSVVNRGQVTMGGWDGIVLLVHPNGLAAQ